MRNQLRVLIRSRPRQVRLTGSDRRLWVWLSRVWQGWRAAVVIVAPETVITWHRRGFHLFWRWKSRHRGRPTVSAEVRMLIRTSQTWRTFLANHLRQIMAADFFVVPNATCRLLFAFVVLAHLHPCNQGRGFARGLALPAMAEGIHSGAGHHVRMAPN